MNPTRHIVMQSFGCKSILVLFSFLFFAGLASAQLSVSISGVSPTCNGWTNGSVTATATGGTSPYIYSWSNGVVGAVNGGLGAGTYSVTATDANNQTATATFTLTQPAALSVSVSLANVCSGNGNATANVSGGVAPYSYAWSNGASGASVTGLPAGFQCVTVTDANGCQAIGCVNVAAALSISMVVKGIACFNFCDASVEAVVTGGTGPYTYSWSNGATGSVNENLGPGTYAVTATDANGCTITGSATVGNPLPILIDISVTNPPCGGGATGTATATASGGSGPYQFLWSTGATTPTISGLAPGSYGLTVTDANGCTGASAAIITQQGNVNLQVLTTASTGCGAPDGTASVIISGGTPPFNILWSNGSTASDVLGLAPGSYTVVVTDANGCGASGSAFIAGATAINLNITGVNAGCASNGSANAMVTPGSGTAPYTFLWNTGATTPIINNLTAGTYSVTVTDAAGCTKSASVTVTGSANLTINATSTNVSCFGGNNGTATATASGGSSLFFVWSNGGTGQTITGLSAGTYFVTVMDAASGCTATTATFVSQPQPVTATATATNATCTTLGSATASASGGTGTITFKWSTGATTATITGLVAGTYTVTATDANGCTGVATATVTGTSSVPTVNISVTSPLSGNNATDGALTAQVTGGTGPYTYLWSTGATTASISGLGAGTYSVTVTDANGCTDDDTETLFNPGCIGDRIWLDVDKDGCQDANLAEFGFAGVTLMLTGTTSTGASVNMTTVTDQVGQYLFSPLAPGTYQVKITLPNNFTLSPANSSTCGDIFSSSDFLDSDFNANGSTSNIVLAEGQCNLTIDGGLYDICINLSTPGVICCDQTLCGPGGDPAPITATTPASGGSGTIQYMWMYSHVPGPFNNATWFPIVDVNGVPTATGSSYDPGPIYQTTYFIRCAKSSTCEDWLESNIVTITVDDIAVANISGPDLVCVGDPASYSSVGNNPPNATYLWNFGNWATPQTSTQPNVTVTWNTAGVVYITLKVTVGSCVSTAVLGVAISDSPVICGNALVINTTNMGAAVMVEWNIPHTPGDYDFVVQRSKDGVHFEDIGTVVQAEASGTHQYAYADHSPKHGNSFYRLDVRSNNAHLIYSNVERVAMFSSVESFVIRPNPVTDHITIECNKDVKTAVKMEVLSLQGKLVSSQKLDEGMVSQPVDLSHLSGGVYLLRLTFNDGVKEIHKIVKE